MNISRESLYRFNRFFNYSMEGCWEWKGCIGSDGYGKITINSKTHQAHRIAYLIYNGVIEESKVVRHSCDNPKCVRPSHLLLGTHLDNMQDMVLRGRRTVVKNPQFGQKNHFSKLTNKEAIEIFLSSEPVSKLRRLYSVSAQTIRNIKSRRSWTYITKDLAG